MDFLPPAFVALDRYSQFIIYKIIPSAERPGKQDKVPVSILTGFKIDPHDPANWMQSKDALTVLKTLSNEYGLGFVLTANDPFWFLDIDQCFDLVNNAWSQIAIELCTLLNGAAVEVSQSRQGLHIIGSGICPPHGCTNKTLHLEFYTEKRFIALTGFSAIGLANFDAAVQLPHLINLYFSKNKPDKINAGWTNSPCENWCGPEDDTFLIDRALRSHSAKSIFNQSATFKDLWEGNFEVLERTYHSDESSYDGALALHLAYWTGNNCERILKLMWQSKLVREKWERLDYLTTTILTACAKQTAFLCDAPTPASLESSIKTNTFLNIEQQVEKFKGCTYVRDVHKILTPEGDLLRPEQFRAAFGGYTFIMDLSNQRISRNAWEAFTESQITEFPWAHSYCFRPEIEPNILVEEGGRKYINTWRPINVPRKTGDLTLFFNHVNKILPNEHDQRIILSYMAACVQFKGKKFQWAPLIQGVDGNGKTLLTRAVANAIGAQYVHFPRARELTNKFNSWMYGTIFIGVEDICVSENQLEVIEALKPMITNEWQPLERKGVDQVSKKVCCNFMLNSNHKNGLRKTRNDRRFAPFFTPQQVFEDLQRDGLTNTYFINLYNWLEREGYAVISEYLHTFKIPDEYNPANGERAPITTSTEDAIEHGLGSIEQEILEAIDQGLPGFKNGWISSIALDRLLIQHHAGRKIPRNRRKELLVSLGYDWHPGLLNGRVNRVVDPDNGKPKLFISKGHFSALLTDPTEIARIYSHAQNNS